jgi:hypothetical protein
MIGDITIYDTGSVGTPAAKRFVVASSATTIKAGEPVAKPLGNSTGNVVAPMATNKPVVGTDFLAGIASSTSTNTASAAGIVDVLVIDGETTYLIAPNAPTSWDTQAEYDALVGARVLLDLTTSVYTILASDSATNGCVVEPLDIAKFPGKVRFSLRLATNYFA